MIKLFEIETADVELNWRAPAQQTRVLLDGISDVPGHLNIRGSRAGVIFTKVWRASVPTEIAHSQSIVVGPQLYEQTDYRLYARSKNGKRIDVVHADPNVRKSLSSENDQTIIFGTVNFKSEVGYSKFAVVLDGQPEFEFEIEVFPTKIDYKSDYEQLIAETQDYVYGLVYEYLRSTYKLSIPVLAKQSSSVEWLLLLQMVVHDLEQSCDFIAHHPIRGLIRERHPIKAEKLKRLDSAARLSILRGSGSGHVIRATEDLHVRQQVLSSKVSFNLETPEHRWISVQLKRIRERLLALLQVELLRDETERRKQIIADLQLLEHRIFRLQQLEPFRDLNQLPPAGFASLQLVSAPGYRECYKACNTLTLGLSVEGGPLNLSLKEISLLYEYWCFLTVVNLLSKAVGQRMPGEQLVKARSNGLEMQLTTGKESTVRFKDPEDRVVEVTYNKRIHNDAVVIPQKPDIMISLKYPDWPPVNILLDAKYRVRYDEDYLKRYLAPGPDIDAINALHRYRDAILEFENHDLHVRPKRTVVQAAALFPFRETALNSYRKSVLWDSLDRLGIGAIPLVPGCKYLFEDWLYSMLRHGGWSIAEQAIRHRATDRSDEWRVAASESVLVGVLNSGSTASHLDWIEKNRCYYMPLLKDHPRQLSVKHVAIYVPASIRTTGAVDRSARVIRIEVKRRSEILTPWSSAKQADDLQVVYLLDDMRSLRRPIMNRSNDKSQRFSSPRWSSRLSLERARTLTELLLESEPEWKLYEELRAAGLEFKLAAGAPSTLMNDGKNWRVWFESKHGFRVRHAGIGGFRLELPDGAVMQLAHAVDVADFIRSRTPPDHNDLLQSI